MKLRGIAATVIGLAILVLIADLDGIGAALGSVTLPHLAVGIGLVQVQILLSAVRWRATAVRLGQDIPMGLAIREYYIGTFLNQVLPGGMAGDVVRVIRLRRDGEAGGWMLPAKAVVFERLSGQAALFLVGGCGMLGVPLMSDAGTFVFPRPALATLAGICAGIAIVLWIGWRWAVARAGTVIRDLGGDLHRVFIARHAWILQSIVSLLIVLAYIAVFCVTSAAVDAPLPVLAALAIVPLCLVTMLIPATIGGWGTREAAAAALWPIVGSTSSDGVAASILYGLVSLAGALPGLVLLTASLIFRRSEKH